MKKEVNHSFLYGVLDVLSGQLHHFVVCPNDGLAVRTILLSLQVPLKDNVLYRFCDIDTPFASPTVTPEYDISQFNFSKVKPVKVDWSAYRFPVDVAEAVAPLGCSPDEIRQITLNHQRDSVRFSESDEVQSKVDKIIGKE